MEGTATLVVLDSKGEEISEHVAVALSYTDDPEPTVWLSDAWIPGPLSDPSEIVLYRDGQKLGRVPIRSKVVAASEGLSFPRRITMA